MADEDDDDDDEAIVEDRDRRMPLLLHEDDRVITFLQRNRVRQGTMRSYHNQSIDHANKINSCLCWLFVGGRHTLSFKFG
jgi:hypothetical protein